MEIRVKLFDVDRGCVWRVEIGESFESFDSNIFQFCWSSTYLNWGTGDSFQNTKSTVWTVVINIVNEHVGKLMFY